MNLILVVSSLRSHLPWISGSTTAIQCTNSITFCMLAVILQISRDSIIPYRLFLWPRRFLFIFLFLKQAIPTVMRIRNPHPTGTAMLSVRPIELSVICPVFTGHSFEVALSPNSFQADILKMYSVLHLSDGRSLDLVSTVTLI